jgi:hypothetical protein
MEPIHKFNNGRGAMLCNGCRTIISTGPKTDELYCDKCKQKNNIIEIMKDDESLGLYDEKAKCYCGHTTYCECGPDATSDAVNRQGKISEGDLPSIIDFEGPTKLNRSEIQYVKWNKKKQLWEKYK